MRVADTCTVPIVAMAQGGHSNQDKIDTKHWVVNLSQQPLTQAQQTVLAHGPNCAVTPKTPPFKEYITAAEVACQSLKPSEADEFRAEIARKFETNQTTQTKYFKRRVEGHQRAKIR